MSRLKFIWLATQGEYSDKSIEAAFTSEAHCQMWIAEQEAREERRAKRRIAGSEFDQRWYISEWNAPVKIDLNPPLPSQVRRAARKAARGERR